MRKILRAIFRPFAKIFYKTTWIYRIYHSTLAYLAGASFGFPARHLMVVGITGTNGKSTTTFLVAQILKKSGYSVGMISTVNFWIGDEEKVNQSKLTSLSPETIQSLLSQMVKAGNKLAVIEVSSHGIKQNRIAGISFTAAGLTNITHDHLDYHQSVAEYVHYKEMLFTHLRRRFGFPTVIAVNATSQYAQQFANHPADRKLFYNSPDGDLRAENIIPSPTGSHFEMIFPDHSKHTISLPLPGHFNIENALAASALCFGLGVSSETIATALNEARPVPGRMETIPSNKPFQVIVDYAHTPDGFEKALSSAKQWTKGNLIAVFGSAGDRDKTKRPILAQVASRFADHIFLTEEDAGSEDVSTIIQEIRAGIPKDFESTKKLTVIENRKDAIRTAISQAKAGDTILLLAMGAQTMTATKQGLIPYNEREFVRDLLQSTID